MYVIAAPGIADIHFGTGGINLKHFPAGSIGDADGESAKYMHPTNPVAGANKFRLILEHEVGMQHTFQIIFRLFKP